MGAAEARLFAREGAQVVIGDVLEAEGRSVEAEINAKGGKAVFVRLDVTSEADWQQAVGAAQSHFGRLNVLVNNAGIGGGGRIEDTTVEDWDRMMAINAKGVFLGTKTAIPAMRRAGGGSIINISSQLGLVGNGQQQPAVPGLEGRRPSPDEGHGHPVRPRGHPRELRPPRPHRHGDDRAAPRRSRSAHVDDFADPARPLRRAGRGRLRCPVPGLGRVRVSSPAASSSSTGAGPLSSSANAFLRGETRVG